MVGRASACSCQEIHQLSLKRIIVTEKTQQLTFLSNVLGFFPPSVRHVLQISKHVAAEAVNGALAAPLTAAQPWG